MTYEEAQKSVKLYLQYDGASDAIKARLDELIPTALNNARLWAERRHNWALAYRNLWCRVTASDGGNLHALQAMRADLDSLTPPAAVKMKSVQAAFLEGNTGDLSPLMIRPLGAVQRLKIQKRDLQVDDPFWPEATDYDSWSSPYLTVNGLDIAVVPENDCVVRVDGYAWLAPYTTQDQTDFMLEHVPDVLIWKAVIDSNYVAGVFVNRQDGNVGIPTAMLQDAWDSAMDWDSHMHQSGINYQLG